MTLADIAVLAADLDSFGWPESVALVVAVASAIFAWRSDQRAGRAETRAESAAFRALEVERRERERHEAEMERHERERVEAENARRARLHLEPIPCNRKNVRDGVRWFGAEVRVRNTSPAPAQDFRVWLGEDEAESLSKIAEWAGVLTKDDREGRLFSVEIQERYLRPNLRWVIEWTDDEGERLLVSRKGPVGQAFTDE